ncbi:porin [Caballeronia sp. M23-90]
MKKFALSSLSLALLGAAGAAHSQNSVALYGVLDESLQYVHNANASNQNFLGLIAGNLQGNRWGLKGAEDLGGGLKAIFQLENGFNPNNGKLGQGGLEFGRQAYVGLQSDQFGTVTIGRQYDPVVDLVQPITADNYFGPTFTTPSDVDNNDNSSRTNSAIKYASNTYSGFQFEAMYAFGGIAGSTGSGQTWSGAATYASGPFSVAAGYIRMDNGNTPAARAAGWGGTSDGTFNSINLPYQTAKSIGIASIGAQYVVGPIAAGLRYSNAQYKPDALSSFKATERYNVGAGFVNYRLTPAALLGLGYTFMHGSGNGSSASYNQISLGGDYNLSKRTDVYLVGAYQRVSGTGATATVGDYDYPSNSTSQELVSLGIRHKF